METQTTVKLHKNGVEIISRDRNFKLLESKKYPGRFEIRTVRASLSNKELRLPISKNMIRKRVRTSSYFLTKQAISEVTEAMAIWERNKEGLKLVKVIEDYQEVLS